ncbi:hypothetical protein [Haloarchaeobius sp. TZWSO28]|uniref:hypothetical protein n=1 Tax=Haloarchaeobius sp. TZWSO28 TaxID=3446119 RepID=UPI003EBCD16D
MRRVHLEAVETTRGDVNVRRRAALVDAITDAASEIDDIDALEEALEEVRRQRREAAAAGTRGSDDE